MFGGKEKCVKFTGCCGSLFMGRSLKIGIFIIGAETALVLTLAIFGRFIAVHTCFLSREYK